MIETLEELELVDVIVFLKDKINSKDFEYKASENEYFNLLYWLIELQQRRSDDREKLRFIEALNSHPECFRDIDDDLGPAIDNYGYFKNSRKLSNKRFNKSKKSKKGLKKCD